MLTSKLNVIERIQDVLQKHQDRPFLVDSFQGRILHYGDFHRLACGLAAGLQKRGIQRGDRVALVLTNSVEFAGFYFACLYLGAVAVPVNIKLHAKEIEFILNHSGAKVMVVSAATKAFVPAAALSSKSFTVWDLPDTLATDFMPTGNSSWQPFQGVQPDDLFSVTFTSGTTSQPKGVPHTIRSLFSAAQAFNEELEFGPNNRFYHVLVMAYMAGFLNTLLCPFLAGSSVVIGRPFDAQMALDFWDIPIRHQANTFWLVPTILSTLLRIDRNPAGAVYSRAHAKTVCVGTAPLPLTLKREFESRYGVTLLESYGLSETLFVTTNSRKVPYVPGSVGRLLPGVELKIVDGEIAVRTPFQMAGYLNTETLQPEPSKDEWFPTGDVGHVTDDHLFITDRKKDLIIRGGINISPKSIEDVLMEHPSIQQVAVVGTPDEFYGEAVAAVVKLKPGFTLEKVQPELQELCRKNLSAVSIPARWEQIEEMPLGSTGKLQKRKLREWLTR